MTPSELAPEVIGIVEACIDSLGQLEVLLLLHRRRPAAVSAAAVGQELGIDATWATTELRRLVTLGLAAEGAGDGHFRFAPSTADLEHAVAALAEAYARQRVTVVALIMSKPSPVLRGFADAFRLRRKD